MIEKMIARPSCIRQLKALCGSRLIKIVTGPRGCGKTCLLQLFREELRKEGVTDEQMLVYDLTRFDGLHLLDPDALHADILKRKVRDRKTYVFIEEVQECHEFERLLAGLHQEEDIEIYATCAGMNALFDDQTSCLAGLYETIEMLPLSFAEFREAVKEDNSCPDREFNEYLQAGSYPECVQLRNDPEAVRRRRELLIDLMIYKDCGQKLRMKDSVQLKRMIGMLTACAGSPVSARSIARDLSAQDGIKKISDVTVGKYLNALTDCGMFVRCPSFDCLRKKEMTGRDKYYPTDPGIPAWLTGSPASNLESLLENVVFLELKRRHQFVWAGKVDDDEIDFVCRDGDEILYVQVAASVMDENILEREMRPFTKLRDRFPCCVLTMDCFGAGRVIDGVKIVNVVDWLLAEEV